MSLIAPPRIVRPRVHTRSEGRSRQGGVRAFFAAPVAIQLFLVATCLVTLWLCTNWVYQVLRKPSELFFPVSGSLNKTPAQTWREYSSIFKEHSTRVVTAQLLAALAQVEGSGNPLVQTYWRWSWIAKPFEVYKPASSAVGMYQMTDGTFEEARHYCIREHVVVQEGVDDDGRSCSFTLLYSRLIPSHAVELTAAYLDMHVAGILAHHRAAHASLHQKQDLAAVIHLCGAGAADLYAKHGFRFAEGERCGDHDPRLYVARVNEMMAVFARLATDE
jgi:hypothetical protein